MKKTMLYRFAIVFLISLIVGQNSYGGKIDQVKVAVKSACNKDLGDTEIMESVIKAFDCTSGTDVTVTGCKIKCLKENSGSVVGK